MNHEQDLTSIIQCRYERRKPFCYILVIVAMNNDVELYIITYFLCNSLIKTTDIVNFIYFFPVLNVLTQVRDDLKICLKIVLRCFEN